MSDSFEPLCDGSIRYHNDLPFRLESGAQPSGLTLVYETWGALNAKKSNAVLVHHALSVGAHARKQDQNPGFGWWQKIIGPGKAIDTENYFIIYIKNLGI
jgi:homoserine O-acetyltransferase